MHFNFKIKSIFNCSFILNSKAFSIIVSFSNQKHFQLYFKIKVRFTSPHTSKPKAVSFLNLNLNQFYFQRFKKLRREVDFFPAVIPSIYFVGHRERHELWLSWPSSTDQGASLDHFGIVRALLPLPETGSEDFSWLGSLPKSDDAEPDDHQTQK